MNPQKRALQKMRVLHGILLFSILLYVIVGEKFRLSREPPAPAVLLALMVLAATVILTAQFFRARMVTPSGEKLRLVPEDPVALENWRKGNVVCLLMCESVALYGFMVRYLGYPLLRAIPFYVVAAILMLIWTPRLEIPTSSKM